MAALRKPPDGSRITLRGALVALGTLLVFINVGSAFWDAAAERGRTEVRAQRDLTNLTGLLAEQTASALDAVDLVLRDAAREGSAANVARAMPRLRDEMAHVPQVASFIVLDREGRVVARTNDTPTFDPGLSDRPVFTEHRDRRAEGLYVSAPYESAANGNWRFALSRHIESSGSRFAGVVVAVLEIDNFDRLYRAIDLGGGGFITLRSREGVVITRVPDPLGARGHKFTNSAIDAAIVRDGRFTGWTTSPILNERVLLSASAIRGFPVHVMSGATERSVFMAWRSEALRIAARALLASAAMVALIALAAWGLARREQALRRERELADAERWRLEQRVRQAEKMEAVGRLAGGIAHDFNNILGGILGYAELLFEQTVAGSPLKRYAQNVLTAANRARGLVDQILAYSRSQRARHVPVDFGRVAAETLELARGSLAPGMRLEVKLPETPVFVVGDATQLHQVLMNLYTNAVQALGESGTLRVTLESAELEAERALPHGVLQPGPYARLIVEDTGAGMDDATIARAFEPFFTTKEVGKGTGLGLSLVYGIVTDSGGGIDVKSAPGRGTTFTIWLPRVDAAAPAAHEDRSPVPRGHGERVLVIDDEESLVAVTSEVLLGLGYEPVGYSDSGKALAEFETAPERFDAAITDEVMPGMTGTELAARLHRRRADLPIVLVSGYFGPMLAERARGAGVTGILKKPVQTREIAQALAHALRRAA